MSLQNKKIDEVLPGSELADNLADSTGRVLLRRGTLLTESALDALRRRGVETLPVIVAGEGASDPQQVAAERQRIERLLDERFVRAGKTLAAQVLHQAARECLFECLAEGRWPAKSTT